MFVAKLEKLEIHQVKAVCEADRFKREKLLTASEGNVHGSGRTIRLNSTRNVSFNLAVAVEAYWRKTRKQAVREDKGP